MNILLLGKYGQLGWELNRALATLGDVVALDYPEIDLSRPGSIAATIEDIRPQVIVNATAYTAVDKAESERDSAFAINVEAPGAIAETAARINAGLIHYSTDYVFDGRKGSAYIETDEPNPINIYGESKLAGERAVLESDAPALILRTSWVYSLRKDSFVTKVLAWASKNERLKIVDDQVGSPTWARMLAEISAQILAQAQPDPSAWLQRRAGVYHLAGDGAASRFEWAKEILKFAPQPDEIMAKEIDPAKTEEFPTAAERPLYSALDCSYFYKTFGLRLPDWKSALQMAMSQ